MDYRKIYNSLIKKALERPIDKNIYYEKHHILPKSKGGSNAKSNLVYLTGREHFVAHMLLAYIYGGGMWAAAKMMKVSNKNQSRKLNSRLYEIAKKNWSDFLKQKPRPQHVIDSIKIHAKGRLASSETKAKMSAIRKGKPRHGNPQNWKHSDEAKKKMSVAQKMRVATLGSTLPVMRGEANPMKKPENRKKISDAKKLYWQKFKSQKQLILHQ
jgi:hypothetical protein